MGSGDVSDNMDGILPPPAGFIPYNPQSSADDAIDAPPPGFVPYNPASAPAKKATYSGTILPFSKDENGKVRFDWHAGIPGLIGSIFDSAKSGATLPHDVMQGQVDLNSPEGIKRTLDLATLGLPIAPPWQVGAKAAVEAAPSVADVAPKATNEVVDAATRLGVDIPKAVATDNMSVQRAASLARNVPFAGEPLIKASKAAQAQLESKVGDIADTLGHGSSSNVANRIGNVLGDAADAEANASAQTLKNVEQEATTTADRAIGTLAPNDMGAQIAERLKSGEQAARDLKDSLYSEAGQPGQAAINAGEVGNLAPRVAGALNEGGWRIDNVLTPAASRMMDEVTKLSKLEIPEPIGAAKIPNFVRNPPQVPLRVGPPPQSLHDFIRKAGGIVDEGGDLKAMGLDNLIAKKPGAGMGLDDARLAAAEAGYLGPNIDDAMSNTFTNDLLNALEKHPVYSVYDEKTLADREAIKDILANKKGQPRSSGWSPVQKPTITDVDLNSIENTRKALNRLAQSATNDGDRAAARIIIKKFDEWQGDAIDKGLFSGSDRALQAIKDARSANADWRTRFGYNGRDDADKLLNKIVTGDVTPREVSNWIVGSSKIGSAGSSARLIDRIAQATHNDPETMRALRAGIWNRLTQSAEGVTAKKPEDIANSILEFLNGSGRSVANRLFDEQQRKVATNYANTIRNLAAPRDAEPIQKLVADVLGRTGKSDESLFASIDSYAKSGARADLHTLANILRIIPQEDKGNLAGAIVRNMGLNRAKEWSGDIFLSNWRNYSPGAKTLLFGNAGELRRSLDDIATISAKFKDLQKFANPSGTAQNVIGLGEVAWVLSEPVTAISAIVGGNVVSRMLAAPATAKAASRWSLAYEKAVKQLAAGSGEAARNAAYSAFRIASKNLATALNQNLGTHVAPNDFLRALQGSKAGRADDRAQ